MKRQARQAGRGKCQLDSFSYSSSSFPLTWGGGSIFLEFFDLKEEWEHLEEEFTKLPQSQRYRQTSTQQAHAQVDCDPQWISFHHTRYNDKAIGCQSKLCHIVIEISLKKHLTPLTRGNIFWSFLMCLILFPIQFHFLPMPVTTHWEKPCPEKLPHTCTKWHVFIVALSRRGKTWDKKKNLRRLTCPSREQINKWRYFHVMNYIQ